MSYDIQVYGAKALEAADFAALVASIEDLRASADRAGFVIERELRGSFEYGFYVDGPLRVEREDLPDPVAASAVGARWTYQLTVEGSGGAGIRVAQRFARQLAERTDGVVYDPQDDAVTWPRGGTRRFKVEAAETIDVVELEWFVRREGVAAEIAEVVFDGIESFVPEALPRRFGSFEPLQHRLDEVGKSGFVEVWREEPSMLFWKATRPCVGGSMHGLGDRLLFEPAAGSNPVGSVKLSFDARVLRDDRWRVDLMDFFTLLCERTAAFYAHAAVARNLNYHGGNIWYGPDARSNPSVAVRNAWMGLPPFDVWLAWYGELYRNAVMKELAASVEQVRSGLLFIGTDPLAFDLGVEAAGPLWRRRRPRSGGESSGLGMPARYLMTVDESPLHGSTSHRAASVPEGL